MGEPIIYVDRSEVREGKANELENAMALLAGFVAEKEPQLMAYHFYLDGERHRMSVIAVHPDSESMEFHMDVAGAEFRRFGDLIQLTEIDLYGLPSERVLAQLRAKADMLGGGRATVTVHEHHAGFTRLGATAA